VKLIALILVLSALSALAEQPWPTKEAEATFSAEDSACLPKKLQAVLLTFDDYGRGTGALPDQLQVCRVHLTKGGPIDFIVMVPDGFSGGPDVHFFKPDGTKFIEIGCVQALRYFGPRIDGYYQLITQGNGGAGAQLRILWRFKNGRYHAVRATDYQLGESGGLKFVRERDPKEFSSW